ncbi:hypothetical protein ACFLY6_03325 [Candidatus Dependentiae bacterium]
MSKIFYTFFLLFLSPSAFCNDVLGEVRELKVTMMSKIESEKTRAHKLLASLSASNLKVQELEKNADVLRSEVDKVE